MRILFIWLWLIIGITGCVATTHVDPPAERQAVTEAAVVKKIKKLKPKSSETKRQVQRQAKLFWNPPTTNIYGAPLTDLAGYKIYYGKKRGRYPNVINAADPSAVSYTVRNLSPGTYYFVITAYNKRGYESPYSNVATKTIPHKAPQK